MSQNGLLAKVIDHHDIAFVQIRIQNPRQDRLVERHELLRFPAHSLIATLVLFLDNLHQGTYIDVAEF